MITYLIHKSKFGPQVQFLYHGKPVGSFAGRALADRGEAEGVAYELAKKTWIDTPRVMEAVMVARDECIDRGLIAG